MFKATITNENCPQSPWSASFPTQQEAEAWLQKQIGKPNRLPERHAPKFDENNEPILDENGEQVIELIPAEFTAEIVDLTKDQAWLDAQLIEKRKAEYPSIETVVEALIEHIAEGRPQKLQEIQAQREAVKIKYPKQQGK